jgi:uncharacterized membrane protein YhhN
MVALIAAAAAMDAADDTARAALLVALVLSTLGDVFLLGGERARLFVAGLGAFLCAHIAYVAAFWLDGVRLAGVVPGVVLGAALVGLVGRRVVAAAKAGDEPELAGPVQVYVLVIGAMVVSAVGTGDPWAIAGAALFASSDSLIAWQRFVTSRPWGEVTIIVTYHLAQLLLVISFV